MIFPASPLLHDLAGAAITALQLAAAPAILGLVTLSPPNSGEMLLLPLSHDAQRALVAVTQSPGTRIVTQGPTRGSIIVWGQHAEIAKAVEGAAVLVLAVPGSACSESIT